MTIHLHQATIDMLDLARDVMRAKPGTYKPEEEDAAISLLLWRGDHADVDTATRFCDARNRADLSRADPLSAFFLMITIGFVLAGMAAVLVL